MKKLFDFVDENAFGIFAFIGFIFISVFFIIFEIQLSKADMFDLEESCFNFYKENNYILDECYKYSNKLKGE